MDRDIAARLPLQMVQMPVTHFWTDPFYVPSSRLGHLLEADAGRGGDGSGTLPGTPDRGSSVVERQKHRLHHLILDARAESGRLSTYNREVVGSIPTPGHHSTLRAEPLGDLRRFATLPPTSLTRRLRGSSVSAWDATVGYLVKFGSIPNWSPSGPVKPTVILAHSLTPSYVRPPVPLPA